MNGLRLNEKIIIVTGAAGGLGQAMIEGLLSKAAIPHFLKQRWGRIVNITTSMDTMIRRGWTPYGPSKGALEAQSAC